MFSDLSLTLCESPDVEDGVVHLDSADMRQVSVMPGDIVSVEGARRLYLTVVPALVGDRNQRLARVSPLTMKNIGFLTGQKVRVTGERIKPAIAELVTLQADDDIDQLHIMARQRQLGTFWNKRVLSADDMMSVPTLDSFPLHVRVTSTQPQGPVQITHATEFSVAVRKTDSQVIRVGGLRDLYKIGETLLHARFTKGLLASAHSVLLKGPAGCGKSLLIKRLAHDFRLELYVLDVQQMIDKAVSHGNFDIGHLLSELARRGRTILLIDHLEALTLLPTLSSHLATAAHTVMMQISALLDEIPTQPNVMAFAIRSGMSDDGFLLGEKFDLTLPVDAPNRWGREEVLLLATEGMNLGPDVTLSEYAAAAVGMTARDLTQAVRAAYYLSGGASVGNETFTNVFRSARPSALTEVICDVPCSTWDEVAGLDDIKQLLHETMSWSLYQFDKFAVSGVKPPRSILISGGPGTGKTSLIRGLASSIPMHFIELSCPLLIARHHKDSCQFLRESFMLARRKAPCLLFLDDIDVLFAASNDEAETIDSFIVSQLVAELDSLATMSGVVAIAATNRPDRLTPEMLKAGRFDYAVTFPMPDLLARKKVLQIHARKLPLSADIDFDRLAANTQGMSPSEISNLCNRVGLMAIRMSLNTSDGVPTLPVVTAELFDQALRGRKSN